MNNTVGAFFKARALHAAQEDMIEATSQALKLDTETYIMRITAPQSVAGWSAQVNGALQLAVLDLRGSQELPNLVKSFEDDKNSMLLAMIDDLQAIESSEDRIAYERRRLPQR